MYRRPLIATTLTYMLFLKKLDVSFENFYGSLFDAFSVLADRYRENDGIISFQDLDLMSLLEERLILKPASLNEGKDCVKFPVSILMKHPKSTYEGNYVWESDSEIAIIDPFLGFTVWLNTTASNIWCKCDAKHSVSQIVDKLQLDFPGEKRSILENDTLALLDRLIKLNFVAWE